LLFESSDPFCFLIGYLSERGPDKRKWTNGCTSVSSPVS
jgi:hypothetical protein